MITPLYSALARASPALPIFLASVFSEGYGETGDNSEVVTMIKVSKSKPHKKSLREFNLLILEKRSLRVETCSLFKET